jgi:phage FluMu protein Com
MEQYYGDATTVWPWNNSMAMQKYVGRATIVDHVTIVCPRYNIMTMQHYSVHATIVWPCCNILALLQSFGHAAIACPCCKIVNMEQ